MGEVGERAAVGLAAGLELLLRDEHGGDEARADQEDAHDQRGGGQELLGVADAAGRLLLGVVRVALHVRHDRHTGLEARQAERELGEDEEGDADHGEDVAVLGGQGGGPVGDDMALGEDVPEAADDDDHVEAEVDADEDDGDADGFEEALEEHRAEQGDQHERDDHLFVVECLFEVGVLDEVGGGVGRRQGDGDEEVGRGEAEEGEDEELALPEGQQSRQHGDGALAARALLGDPPVDGQGAGQGDDHQDDRGDGGEQSGGQGRDAGLVAEGGEVVDAGQAHHPPPALALVPGVRGRLHRPGGLALPHVGETLQHPRTQSSGAGVVRGGHRVSLGVRWVSAFGHPTDGRASLSRPRAADPGSRVREASRSPCRTSCLSHRGPRGPHVGLSGRRRPASSKGRRRCGGRCRSP
ncbi:hypothetical protein STANM337S_00758 [Streptomyces tanashiensis]